MWGYEEKLYEVVKEVWSPLEEHDLQRVTFCHMVDPDAPSITQLSVVLTHESHSGKKINALPAENNSLLSPSQTGSCDHYVRGKLNFFLPLFLAWQRIMVVWHLFFLSCHLWYVQKKPQAQPWQRPFQWFPCKECLAWLVSAAKKLDSEALWVCSITRWVHTILSVLKRLLTSCL